MARAAKVVLSKEDLEIQKQIIERTNRSLAILGRAFVRNGSGIFLNIRSPISVKRAISGASKKIKKRDPGISSDCGAA